MARGLHYPYFVPNRNTKQVRLIGMKVAKYSRQETREVHMGYYRFLKVKDGYILSANGAVQYYGHGSLDVAERMIAILEMRGCRRLG